MVSDRIVYSSFKLPPQHMFRGYCFEGNDFVYGELGEAEFYASTGRTIIPGNDGCYVAIRPEGKACQVGVDGAGMAKLFYYDDGSIWAFGDSLYALVSHLRSNGVTLEPNLPQLHAMTWQKTLVSQVSSFETIVRGVKLLPSFNTLIVTESGLKLGPVVKPPPLSYEDALEAYLETWYARMKTLLSHKEMSLSSDITGGIDSRTLFAMLVAVSGDNPDYSRPLFRSGESPHWAKDFAVAKGLTESFGFPLNQGSSSPVSKLSGGEAFSRWRDVCLGVYSSVYLRAASVDPMDVTLNGGGGENFRHFYPPISASDFLDTFEDQDHPALYREWRREVEQSLSLLEQREPDVPPLILHYREFRNRFHTGRSPHFGVSLSPLNSNLLRSFPPTSDALSNSQLNFDIMETFAPGLMFREYDDASKFPLQANVSGLTTPPVSRDVLPGRVFAARSGVAAGGAREPSAMRVLVDEASNALAVPEVQSLLSRRQKNLLKKALSEIEDSGKFSHASVGKPLSFALAAAFALDV